MSSHPDPTMFRTASRHSRTPFVLTGVIFSMAGFFLAGILLAGILMAGILLASASTAGATDLNTVSITTPRSDREGFVTCHDQTVQNWAPAHDQHLIVGTVAGALFGGLFGNQFGNGRGRILTTVGGAAGGAIIGRKVQGHFQHGRFVLGEERHCTWALELDNGQQPARTDSMGRERVANATR